MFALNRTTLSRHSGESTITDEMLRHNVPNTTFARVLLLVALALLLAIAPLAASQTGLISAAEEPGQRTGTTGSDAEASDGDDARSESEDGTTATGPTRPSRVRGTEVITPSGTASVSGRTTEVQPQRPPRVSSTEVVAPSRTRISENPPSTAGPGATIAPGTASATSPQQAPSPSAPPLAPVPIPKAPSVGANSTLVDPEAPIPAGAQSTAADPEAPIPAGAGSATPDPEAPVAAGADATPGPA